MVYFNKTVDVYKIKEGLERKNQRSSTSKYPIFDSGSESMNAIIHGENSNKSNHYIDALQRFKRDYATIDKEQREKKKESKKKDDERRRNYALFREHQIKHYQEENLNKLITKQKDSQFLHDLGAKRTAHTHSIPVNPISLNYENNERGKRQQQYDEQLKVNKLVRSHHLQMCGNTGYNIINGRNSVHIDEMLPPNTQQTFEEKLSRYYSQFRLDPNQK